MMQTQNLQRELATLCQSTERIKFFISVTKANNKKKSKKLFLVIVVNNLKNSYYLCLAKRSDEMCHKDKSWSFDDIHQIDVNGQEIEILLVDKQSYRWQATEKDRIAFLQTIRQVISQVPSYGSIKLTSIFPVIAFEDGQGDEVFNNEKLDELSGDWNNGQGDADSYQALTSREEADLERLLELEVENTINNAEAFTEKLARDLSQMDTNNIQDIMVTEQRVQKLMQVLQNAIDETFFLENKIIYYESLLKNVRDIVQKVEQKEAIVQLYNDNNHRLLSEVGQLVNKLDFKPEDEHALANCDLNSLVDQSRCLEAALALQESLQFKTTFTLQSLNAVQKQNAYLKGVSQHFAFRLKEHLKKIILQLDAEYQERLSSIKAHESVLSEHIAAHQRLIPYAPFMKWLHEVETKCFTEVLTAYIGQFSLIYEKEFAYFFEYLRERYVYSFNKTNTLVGASSANESKRKSLAVNDMRLELRRSSYAPSDAASETVSTRSSEMSLSEWEDFNSYMEFLLKTIDPVCLAEQQFCSKFFDIDSNYTATSMPSTPVLTKHGSHSEETSISNHSNLSEQSSQSKRSDQLRNILAELFRTFEYEFTQLAGHYDRQQESISSLYFLVRLSNHVLSAQDTGSFLSKAYGNILIQVKRSFDRYMLTIQDDIDNAKAPKRPKAGVLPFIWRFENFAKQTENVIKCSNQRRTDIDRWYVVLIEKIFLSVTRIANEHARTYKTPAQIVELENYHYLQNLLSSLKIPCLKNQREESKMRYNSALRQYVALYFRRPLERLNHFFEGIQQKVQQGVREEEISYQLAFSKQELRKVIKECNLKDIKKGLEEMYKRVEKHVSDPESQLIQVIWRSMQEEFITQYKNIQEMITRCYPQANINLLFSIEDVLNIFSEIAQTH